MTTRRSKRLQQKSESAPAKQIDECLPNEKIQNKLSKLLNESCVLLENESANKFIELSIDDDEKSYSMRRGKIGNKGRKTTKKFKSFDETFNSAVEFLFSKINDGFEIFEEYENEQKEDEEHENDEEVVNLKREKDENDQDDEQKEDIKKSYKKLIISGSAPVDEYFTEEPNVHVFEENGTVYDAMMNQTNIHKNSNKFYKLQILQNNDGETCCWFRWGRVGYKGQTSLTYGSAEECIAKFCDKFYAKTLNEWADRDNFESFARKYTYLPMDYSHNGNEDNAWNEGSENDKEPEKEIESNLDEGIQDLIKLIFDKKMMESQMREIGYDANKLPLGKIHKKLIKDAYEILKEIEHELGQNDDFSDADSESADEEDRNLRRSKRNKKRTSNKSAYKVNRYALTQLSSTFYTLIPHEFGYSIPPPINTEILLKKEMKLIEALSEIEVASRLLSKDKKSEKKQIRENVIDRHFGLLQAEMENVSCKDTDFKMIKKYVKNTHAETHNRYTLNVESVIKINKHGESERYQQWENTDNRMLLWHGSRLTNYVGIISKGLRIAPPEAPVTGYMFGKGVYFADMASKSANYCFTTQEKDVGLLLLCEVALGDVNELFYADYDAKKKLNGKHSTKGVGKTAPNPSQYVRMDNGCLVPLGKPKRDKSIKSSLLYNEYIVYDTSQIRMRYLVKVKFLYNDEDDEW